MSEERKNLFFITETDGRTLYVKNGVVTSSNLKRFLHYAPLRSKELQLGYERDRDKIGLSVSIEPELEFIGDGKTILDKTHYTQTEERELYLLIYQLSQEYTNTDFAIYHKFLWKSRLNFYSVSSLGDRTRIEIAENSLVKKIKAAESTSYDLPLNDTKCVTVWNDGVNIEMTQHFVVLDQAAGFTNIMGVAPTTHEGESGSFAAFPVMRQVINLNNYNYSTSNAYLFSSRYAIPNARFKGQFIISGLSVSGHIYLKDDTGATLFTLTGSPSLGYVTYDVDFTFNMRDGGRYFLVSQSVFTYSFKQSSFSISFFSRLPGTYIKGYPMPVLHKKIIGEMTGKEENAADSASLNTDHVIVSGDGLRSIPNAVLKMTGKTLWEAEKALYGVGMSVESDQVRVEPYEYYLRTDNPIELTNISNYSSEVANDELATEVQIGFPSQNIEGPNGKFSFHNTSFFAGLRPTAEPKAKQFICPIIADPFAQEILRIKTSGQNTTDNSGDNKAYILDTEAVPDTVVLVEFYQSSGENKILVVSPQVEEAFFWGTITFSGTNNNNKTFTVERKERSGNNLLLTVTDDIVADGGTATVSFSIRRLKRPTFTTVEGVPDPTSIYNVLLAPSFLYQKHRKWINSMFYGFEGKKLKFRGTDKSREFRVVYNGVAYDEDADIVIGKERLFIPRIFVFNVPSPVDLVEIKETEPNRPFSFNRGIDVVGFDLKASIGLSDGKEQQFRLLCGPYVDIAKLKDA